MLSCGQQKVGTEDVMAVSQQACSLRSLSAGATGWRAGYFLLFPSQNLKGQRGCLETAKKWDTHSDQNPGDNTHQEKAVW